MMMRSTEWWITLCYAMHGIKEPKISSALLGETKCFSDISECEAISSRF